MDARSVLEARLLVDDPRYETYRRDLEVVRERAHESLMTKRNLDLSSMHRLIGEINALDYALGRPAELTSSDQKT